MQVTGTLTIDVETGKILDVDMISGYDMYGNPKYGVIRIRDDRGNTTIYGRAEKPKTT